MCGIIAYIGNDNSFEKCLSGLKQLQNRGYDSAGICNVSNNDFLNTKFASNADESAINKLEKCDYYANVSIGHTRWATHGSKTDVNSHPHVSNDGIFSLVHNGIIENYIELKNMLIGEGYIFHSHTDSEVVVNLLSFFYKINANVKVSIQSTIQKLEGTWGLAILCKNEPNKIYTTRHGSPILVSINENMAMITSEQSGFCNLVSNYIVLENHDICIIEQRSDTIKLITNEIYTPKTFRGTEFQTTPDKFPYWTIKEIYEQYDSSLRAISHSGRLMSNNLVKLGGFSEHKKELLELQNIILLGCGTSYHAGMIGLHYLKQIGDFCCVQLFDGAEFARHDIPKHGKTGLILLSQSGETKDLHRCIQIGRENDLFLIGVVNVVDSLIAREVDCGCYLNAGREVAVASTKSFTSQVIVLNLIALWFAQEKNIFEKVRKQYIKDLRNLHHDIEKTIESCILSIDDILPLLSHDNCFLLGKGQGEAIAKEGALKIKEISYIHAEGYSTSSLKHGPFALLNEVFPVILLAPDNEFFSKSENTYQEIHSRGANIIYITDKDVEKDNIIKISRNKSFQDLLCVIPLQLIAYKLSLLRNINPDMPRNLAKVVTVE